ncbi:hypothetical protein KFK09_020487 [Dendrobium nobile]|uniref:Uncharacterized protein n=1 Tax=Dendrobium nobile TaxID=94219 RepID=A0A8T3AMK0_DENNO|nr:hypothetical protein KFK09_020487 [Dendrobium nobile]
MLFQIIRRALQHLHLPPTSWSASWKGYRQDFREQRQHIAITFSQDEVERGEFIGWISQGMLVDPVINDNASKGTSSMCSWNHHSGVHGQRKK